MPRKCRAKAHQDPDLYDYENKSGPGLLETRPDAVSLLVADDWPAVVPIGRREIEITETHMEKVLAELLGPLP